MSSENLPVSIGGASDQVANLPAMASAQPKRKIEDWFSPYYIAHQYLRGRYLLAIGAGLILGSGLAYLGWTHTKPLYQSEALIRISYEIPKVMGNNEDYRPVEIYQALMQSQQQLIASNRVLSAALHNPIWAEKSLSVNPDAVDEFASDLKVENKGENLKISYVSPNREFVAAAVKSVVQAYVSVYNSMDKQRATEMTQALKTRESELLTQIDSIDEQLRTESAQYGSANIDKFYEAAVQRLTRVEQALIEVRIALALTDGPRGRPSGVYTPQQIARFDPTMARYLADKDELEMQLEQYRMRGYGEENKFIQETKGRLEMAVKRIQKYASDFQATDMPGAQAPTTPGGATLAGATVGTTLVGRSIEELKTDEKNLSSLTQEAKEAMASLGSHKLKLESLKGQLDRAKDELREVTGKQARLDVDSGLSSRLSVLSDGEVPLMAFRDRRVHVAAAGGLLGMMLPGSVIVGYGMSRRRYRYSEDASGDIDKTIPLLGILPQLPARLTDPESAADAAQCLHQIRVMLQVQQANHGPTSYLLTSACPGEGKTSLAAALALSFATSGARTVVVDGDLIGQRLTHGYGLEDKPGFREAMQSGAKGIATYPSGVDRLSILPAGVSDGRDACSVSAKVVRKMISQLKEEYDIVLLDSGPILGVLRPLSWRDMLMVWCSPFRVSSRSRWWTVQSAS